MTRTPVISVVMPVHNGGDLVARAVRSVVAQTFPGWELLAVDDGSADDTAARLTALAAADPRIVLLRHPHPRGASAARNTALRAARGGVIAYLDHDDEFYPDHFARVAAFPDPWDVLVFGYDFVEERPGSPDFGTVRPYDPTPHFAALPRRNIVTPLGVVHRPAVLARSGAFDESLRRDTDTNLWRRMAAAGAAFTFVPAQSGRYHVRPDSLSRTVRPVEAVRVRAGGREWAVSVPRGEAWRVGRVLGGGEYGGLPRAVLRTPAVVVDVGANVGLFALDAALRYAPRVVHCFEPYPPSVMLLRENTRRVPGVVVHPYGLGRADGAADLHLDPNNSGRHTLAADLAPAVAARVPVRVRDAGGVWDELGLGEVDVLKVDAEGSEVAILESLGPRLHGVRAVLVEFHRPGDRRRIAALLPGHTLVAGPTAADDRGVLRYLRADLSDPRTA